MTVVDEAAQTRERLNTGTKPIAASHRFDEGALARWMAANVEGYAGPLEVRQFRGGQSNPTYQLITPSASYVLRRKPPGPLLPSAHAVDREHRVIAALGASGFPVAKAHGLCVDQGVIGTWFYVMDMVEGRILWDPTLPQYEPPERRAIFMEKISTLAALHNIDHEAIGLADYGKPGNYMGRQVARWTRQYKASETVHIPEMEKLIAWLPGTLPAQERTSLVHGDYRLDNMIFHPTEPRVIAVLDWELSTLGEPLADVTYLLMNWVNGPIAGIVDIADHGLPPLDEAIAIYCNLTGRSTLPHLNWFFSYNAFRLAGIVQGIVGRARDGTANNPQAATMEPRVRALAELGWRFARQAEAGA